ncbi:reticulon-2 isoform X2 [Anas platyrhynchos]|uniref:reticulon-2 isoform X2 n=1 Tax=Anas platyrhynchos TaxID=8839 RepID=UPI003AF2251C
MGQVLGFAHCKEAPSTASTTPDSTEGSPEEPDFAELQAAPEPPEEEEEDEDAEVASGGGRGPPRELTFSYIAFSGGGGPPGEPAPRGRRDPRRGRPPRLNPPPPRGPDPRASARAPPTKCPGGPGGPGGGPSVLADPVPREPPPSLAPVGPPPPPALPPPPAGGAPRAPPLEPPPAPPQIPEGPPPPPNQSPSPTGADVLVWELLYWRAPGRSALALAGTLGTLGCLARFSAVSVGAYGALAVLGVTLPLRLHQVALRALRRGPPTPEQPSRGPGDAVGLSPEQQQRWARRLGRHLAAATRTLTRLFLVHSIPESLKFAFLFYLLTYVGAVFNGVTLLGVGVICAFTFPVLYRHHQAQIDRYGSLLRNHLSHLRARIQAKLPSAKAKPQ